jgi:hypothetical protein
MEAGFTAEQSIEAVEQQGSVAAALEYLMSNGRGELFQPTVDLGQKTSQRKEETMECAEDEGLIVYCDESAEMEHLSLPVLGAVLQELSKFPTAIVSKRTFPKVLKAGQPNLLVTFPGLYGSSEQVDNLLIIVHVLVHVHLVYVLCNPISSNMWITILIAAVS